MTIPSLLRENRTWILTATCLFLIGAVLGFFLGDHVLSADTLGTLPSTSADTELPALSIKSIFFNNATVALVVGAGGFLLAVPSVGGLLTNGFYVGFSVAVAIAGYSDIGVVVAVFAPHGVFEIPGLLLAAAAGLRITNGFYRYFFGRDDLLTTEELRGFAQLMLLSVLLIGIGSVVEVHVTSVIHEIVM